jgi:hypothetical protein
MFPDPAAAVPKLLDDVATSCVEHFRKLGPEPAIELLDREFRRRHVIHDPAPCSPVLWIRIQWEAWPRQIRKEEAQPENASP